MDINNIKTKYEELNFELRDALSRMQLTDKVTSIRQSIKDLQILCPHNNGSYDFSDTAECPYCGKKFRK